MSTIEFTCPKCAATHDRGFVDGTDVFRCLSCGYIGHGWDEVPEIDQSLHEFYLDCCMVRLAHGVVSVDHATALREYRSVQLGTFDVTDELLWDRFIASNQAGECVLAQRIIKQRAFGVYRMVPAERFYAMHMRALAAEQRCLKLEQKLASLQVQESAT